MLSDTRLFKFRIVAISDIDHICKTSSTMRAFFDRDPSVVFGMTFWLPIYFFQCLSRLLSIKSHFYLNLYIPFLFALLVSFQFGLLKPFFFYFLFLLFGSICFYSSLFYWNLDFGFFILSFDRSLILDFFQIFIEIF